MSDLSKKIKSVYFFMNGNVACFDFNGEQVSELQQWSKIAFHLWRTRALELGYDLSNMQSHVKD